MKKKKITFDEFYTDLFKDRWILLQEAFVKEKMHFALNLDETKKTYFLDKASVIAAKTLDVKPGDKVLDMCAAPGGKSLVLLKALEGKGSLTLNDRSQNRRARLRKVIEEHHGLYDWIEFTSHDATKWGLYEQEVYDKILLDAPCSSESHLVQNPKYINEWSLKRTQGLAQKQYAMLASAMIALKEGGFVLYSTCALSPFENDGVIEKLLKKQKDKVKIINITNEEGESTEYGTIFLPDKTSLGPLYFCLIKKRAH